MATLTAHETPTTPPSALERDTMRRVTWRLVPFLMLCYFIAFVDRVNVGFAALTMQEDLALTKAMFGLGGGLFFWAYFLFEVPSNLALERVGARVWIARIMISWGLVGMATALITGPNTFYLSRLLLGAAEAGFFPGVILYLTYWFPARYRARVVALFMVAIPASSFLGSPLSAGLMELDGWLNLHGWQWLFILEGLPACLLGLLCLRVLPDKPQKATWLSTEQKDWLNTSLASEVAHAKPVDHQPWWKVLFNPYVLLFALIYSAASATSNSLSLWQPQIIKSFGMSNMQTGLLNALPFGVACVAMVLWGRRSDRSGERVWNTALPYLLMVVSLAAISLTNSLTLTLVLLALTLIGNYTLKGPFFALATDFLSASTAATGLAVINSVAHIVTGSASWLIGYIKDTTGSFPLALLPLAGMSLLSALLVLWLGHHRRNSVQVAQAGQAS